MLHVADVINFVFYFACTPLRPWATCYCFVADATGKTTRKLPTWLCLSCPATARRPPSQRLMASTCMLNGIFTWFFERIIDIVGEYKSGSGKVKDLQDLQVNYTRVVRAASPFAPATIQLKFHSWFLPKQSSLMIQHDWKLWRSSWARSPKAQAVLWNTSIAWECLAL
jgi:hypothetical protein